MYRYENQDFGPMIFQAQSHINRIQVIKKSPVACRCNFFKSSYSLKNVKLFPNQTSSKREVFKTVFVIRRTLFLFIFLIPLYSGNIFHYKDLSCIGNFTWMLKILHGMLMKSLYFLRVFVTCYIYLSWKKSPMLFQYRLILLIMSLISHAFLL